MQKFDGRLDEEACIRVCRGVSDQVVCKKTKVNELAEEIAVRYKTNIFSPTHRLVDLATTS